MAIIKSIFITFILLVTLSKLTLCLYEDQIGKFDWKKSHIGKLKFGKFESVKRIVIATEENVVASLNLKDGQIVWRQLLESPETHRIELLQVDSEAATTVSGNGNTFYVRGWDLNRGTLLYEWYLTTDKVNDVKWVIHEDQLVHVVPVVNSHIEVTKYHLQTGANKGRTSRVSTPWVTDLNKCAIANSYWVCMSSTQLYYIDLLGELTQVQTYLISNLIGETTGDIKIREFEHSEPAILLERNAVNRLIIIGKIPKSLPYALKNNLVSVSDSEKNLLMELDFEIDFKTNEKIVRIRNIDLETEEKIITTLEDSFEMPKPEIKAGICRGTNCRILITSTDESIVLVQLPKGKIQWIREEALSNVVAVEFVDLPLSEFEASIEREFMEASNDIFNMFVQRIITQIRYLMTFISDKPTSSNNVLVRDNFGLHKLIIIATKAGKLFALDTLTNEIVWSRYLYRIQPYKVMNTDTMYLFLQRTARYAPLSAEMMLVASNGFTGVFLKFNPITGETLSGIVTVNYKIKQLLLLPFEDKDHVKPLVVISEQDDVDMYPKGSSDILHEHSASTFMFNVNLDKSVVTGYNLNFGTLEKPKATPTWHLNFTNSEIVAVNIRPPNERVHSQGRVLADRSVFYKYVNPNLIALATITDDTMHKHVLSVYLIDGVTGLIVYSTHHKRASGPVQMVHSENWIVYSYFNERFRRVEMTSIALYEGAMQSNSTAFSSHALSHLPHVESMSCIFPVNPTAIITTLTERGITNKHLLIALSRGDVVELPWAFLEPRGPHLPEEGNMPYIPELPIINENVINYNQTLGRIKGIQVSPARLESTSLVIVYGLDLYFTRVMPSKTFDVLKEDFDHWLIVMVLSGLALASYITKRLSIRKALKQQWK